MGDALAQPLCVRALRKGRWCCSSSPAAGSNSEHVETIDEIRPALPWLYFLGARVDEKAALWAAEVAELMLRHSGGNRRLAVDRCDPWGAEKLKAKASRCSTPSR